MDTCMLENIVEIAKTVGAILVQEDANDKYNYGCSEQLRDSIIEWAKEFEASWEADNYNRCYFEEIDEFTAKKLLETYGV